VECAAQRFQDTRCFVIRGRGTGAIAYRLLLNVLVQPVTSRCRQRRASVSRRRSTLGAASVGETKPCCSPRNRFISRRTRPSGRWVTAASREECGVVVTCSQIGVWTSVCEWNVECKNVLRDRTAAVGGGICHILLRRLSACCSLKGDAWVAVRGCLVRIEYPGGNVFWHRAMICAQDMWRLEYMCN